jgi:hypothetical protein
MNTFEYNIGCEMNNSGGKRNSQGTQLINKLYESKVLKRPREKRRSSEEIMKSSYPFEVYYFSFMFNELLIYIFI